MSAGLWDSSYAGHGWVGTTYRAEGWWDPDLVHELPAAGGGVTISVPLGTLTLTGFAPAVLTPRLIAAPLGTLTLAGFAPSVVVGVRIAVPLGTLALTGFAPAVLTPRNIAVPLGTLTLQGFAPAVIGGAGLTIAVPLGVLTLQGLVPDVIATGAAAAADEWIIRARRRGRR